VPHLFGGYKEVTAALVVTGHGVDTTDGSTVANTPSPAQSHGMQGMLWLGLAVWTRDAQRLLLNCSATTAQLLSDYCATSWRAQRSDPVRILAAPLT
jgi:hypothetical protein